MDQCPTCSTTTALLTHKSIHTQVALFWVLIIDIPLHCNLSDQAPGLPFHLPTNLWHSHQVISYHFLRAIVSQGAPHGTLPEDDTQGNLHQFCLLQGRHFLSDKTVGRSLVVMPGVREMTHRLPATPRIAAHSKITLNIHSLYFSFSYLPWTKSQKSTDPIMISPFKSHTTLQQYTFFIVIGLFKTTWPLTWLQQQQVVSFFIAIFIDMYCHLQVSLPPDDMFIAYFWQFHISLFIVKTDITCKLEFSAKTMLHENTISLYNADKIIIFLLLYKLQ